MADQTAQTMIQADQSGKCESMRIRGRNESWDSFCRDRGKRYAGCSFHGFRLEHDSQAKAVEILTHIDHGQGIDQGTNIIWYGSKGTGKDHLMAATLRMAIATVAIPVAGGALDEFRTFTSQWVRGSDLFAERRDGIETGQSERDHVREYASPELLMISDIIPVAGTLTPFQMDFLYRILDRRYSEMRSTWITVNVSDRAELENRCGPQIADRLIDGAIAIGCDWPSYRKGK